VKILEPSQQKKKTLPTGKRDTVVRSQSDLVRATLLSPGRALPLVVEPNVEGVSLAEWLRGNRDFIDLNLLRHGGLLFRGFHLGTGDDFGRCVQALGFSPMRYAEGATPRTEVGDRLYTSTEYPADQTIALHNELTYVTTWPRRITFFCVTPAARRGQTPLANVRNVYERIPPRVREPFERRGWMLVRNFGTGLSLPWQQSFHTRDGAEVEAYFRRARIEWEWVGDDGLRTRQVRGAVVRHPETGDPLWFNHVAFWHISSLEAKVRASLEAMFREEELPYNTFYGDGGRIADEDVAEIRAAYAAEQVEFDWRRGDLIVLDNMLVAHGRNPYEGERRILVAMGEPYSLPDDKASGGDRVVDAR
jgi:alpha-ketoglutarate-dependent taurine dioxygenase